MSNKSNLLQGTVRTVGGKGEDDTYGKKNKSSTIFVLSSDASETGLEPKLDLNRNMKHAKFGFFFG